MKKLILLLNIYSSLFTIHFLNAQHYSFRNYSVAQGLGSSSINHIFQDSKGYIWFATQGGGASRFDGKNFKNFTRADGLISNDVTYVTEDKKGHIWIATAHGASVFNGKKFINYNSGSGLTNAIVYCIYADDQNNIWFATEKNGVKIFADDKFRSIEGLPAGEVYTISPGKQGSLWLGYANGIANYNKGKISFPVTGAPHQPFFSSLTDSKGNVWFGSMAGDLIQVKPTGAIEKIQLPVALKNDFIGGITEDQHGNLWLATDHGLLKYTPAVPSSLLRRGQGVVSNSGGVPEGRGGNGGKAFKLFTAQQGLSANAVQAVMCDYQNNIWAGTLSGGVNLLTGEAFVHYSFKEGLSSQNITAICPSPDGKSYFIGTGEGLYLNTGNTFKKIILTGIQTLNITSLSLDQQNNLWITAQEGVFILETKPTIRLKKKYTEINGQPLISPQKAIQDSKGNTWIATFGSGAFLISPTGQKSFNTKTNFPSNNILTVFEDRQNNILFGTQDKGLLKYSPAVPPSISRRGQEVVNIAAGGNQDAIWSIAQDKNGTLFFGTGESGLCIYSNGKTKWLTTKDGLSSDYVPVLFYDNKEKSIWLAGEKGLDKISFNKDYTLTQIHNYNEQDGFSSVAINPNGIYCDTNHLLWLGTANGLWQFNQSLEYTSNTPPKIQLTGVKLFYGKEDISNYYTSSGELVLPYNKNHLTFNIRGLTTSGVLYQTKLEAQDEDWSSATENNDVTYSNISPGKAYTFKAKAIAASGIESNEPVSFSFTITPPWWQTWWFYLLASALFFTGLFIFIKTRESILRQQNIKLEATVKQRTQTIAEQKQTVEKMLGEKEVLLKEIHHRVKNNLQTISSMLMLQSMELKDEAAKKAITESQSRVRSIALVHQKLYQTDGLEKIELGAFVEELSQQIQSLYKTQYQNISVQINIPQTFVLIDKAIPLGLIINELFTNSLKYAFSNLPNAEIRITLETILTENNSHKIKLTYSDNGKGFDYNKISESSSTLGVELIKLLSEQIGATINYSNVTGSQFVFIFGSNI